MQIFFTYYTVTKKWNFESEEILESGFPIFTKQKPSIVILEKR